MKKRIISGVLGLIILVYIVINKGILFDFSVLTISLIGLYEFFTAIKKYNIRPLSIIGYLFTIGLFILFLYDKLNLLPFLLFIYVFSLLVCFVFARSIKPVDLGITLLGGMYISFFLFHLVLLKTTILIWLVFISSWATDTFAYFSGRFFGKRKLCPKLSPKKTVEGAIGGVIGTLIVTIIFLIVLNQQHILQLSILSVISSIIAQIGDLTASKFKRLANIKDYGYIMPGHGGILDRFDSILLTSPIIYYYLDIVLKII
ncbi:phosphatidate cytidylyltransferase [Thermohalobacter berrensis]|uniref:Phosphatidate cytidylyltransferase n=1 Tax=Thermohalobacter berrensis TaxID=99594 RepID=A0A419TBC5_9FIRM|nr:phosphatidate cytidylyltransferase [Thermohalobacter berrensis]RKD34763.1 phosphatidate cytidylyltransferase [Thermohalobacter berrensis]